ncbi:MAG TPA: SAM-dependent methyltransferase [Ornithinicoccus sp.]|nr:SAM-dependent methyltransferase [Ornithinicoccus sp.]
MGRPWAEAWHRALYGPDGFYRRPEGPAGHFATSAQGVPGAGELMAHALLELAARHGLDHVVEVGAGRGELLCALRDAAAERGRTVRLTGLDVVPRPDRLPEDVGWWPSPGGAALPRGLRGLRGALVVAHEWLDVVPCPVVREVDGVWRPLTVDPDGTEEVAGELGPEDAAWLAEWWPVPPHQEDLGPARAEVGRPRDLAYRDLVSRVDHGLVVAVDYGHTRGDRPHHGSLTAYRAGQQVSPRPDGSCDLTAHVAVDSLGAARLVRQRDVLLDLLGPAAPPPHERAGSDPAGYLADLARASALGLLTARGGLGGFWWAVTGRGGVLLG